MEKKSLVGIAESAISDDPEAVLIAPNLGSCLGIAIYDTRKKRGGMIHCLLPLSQSDPEKAKVKPYMYVDTGVTHLLRTLLTEGTQKKDIVIKVAGGSQINDANNVFEIGKKNYTVLRKILWKNNLLIQGEHVGGALTRTVSLYVATGMVTVKIGSELVELN